MKNSLITRPLRALIAGAAFGIISIAGFTASAASPSVLPPAPLFSYQGVGPIVSASASVDGLPRESREFISHNFHDSIVERVITEFAGQRGYEVSLDNGTDIEFDSRGDWTEVDSGDGLTLPDHLLRDILPEHARKILTDRGLVSAVETVKRSHAGYKVELRGTSLPDLRFDTHGHLLSKND